MPLKTSNIRIRLACTGNDDRLPTIRPGAVLYGQVEYKASSAEILSALTVCFLGKLIVKARGGRREVTQVFGIQHPIIRSGDDPVQLDARVHRFPFHFVIPWTTEYDRSATFKKDPQGRFTEAPHRVPPTLGPKAKGDARVQYSCYVVGRGMGVRIDSFATLQDLPKGEELENIQCMVELPQPPQAVLQTVEKVISLPILKISGSLFRRWYTASTEKTSSMDSHTLSVSGPKYVALGEMFSIQTTINHEANSGAGTSNDSWTVSVKRVDLVTKTYRRAKGIEEPWLDEAVSPLLAVKKAVPMQTGITEEVELQLADTTIVTSFKSYTISRFHSLRVTFTSVVGNGKNSAKFENTEELDMDVQIIRVGESLDRRVSGPVGTADINGTRIPPPAYEESPLYQR